MKVAISTDNNYVSEHFGRCPEFTLVDIENSIERSRETIGNPGHYPGNIPKFLHKKGVGCIVCGGMGPRAIGFFNELGIETKTGVTGSIDEVIKKLENGTLEAGNSACSPGEGRGYGIDKSECDHT